MKLDKILESETEFLNVTDLIRLGIFKSRQAFYMAHKRGNGPEHFKTSDRHILVSKQALINWLEYSER